MLESASLPVLQKDKNKQNLSSVFLRLLRGAQNNDFVHLHIIRFEVKFYPQTPSPFSY